MTVLKKLLTALMALALLSSAAVQLNDPDPIRWVLLYGVAALACVLHLFGRCPRSLPLAVLAVSVLWALSLVPSLQPVPLSEVFGEAGMYGPGVEEARELGGLLLVMLGMGPLSGRRSRA